MKKKIKIIFDATIMASGWTGGASRSGIFHASANILTELLRRPELEIALYCSPGMLQSLEMVLKNDFADFPDLLVINKSETRLIGTLQNKVINIKAKIPVRSLLRLKFWQAVHLGLKAFSICYDRFNKSAALLQHASEYDIYFSSAYLSHKLIRNNPRIIRFTLLYDTTPLLFPDYFPFMKFGYSWVKDLVNNLTPEDHCFAISGHSAKDFIRLSPKLNPQNIKITHLAASKCFYQCLDKSVIAATIQKYDLPADKKYIFSLCTIEPRKNLLMAVRCFIRLIEENNIGNLVFVMGGGHWEKFIGLVEKELGSMEKHKEKIIRTGYIDDEDLAPLYSGALFFIYPSLYEGFGLPPLEAMQCGCPVITSNTSSLPEVVGDAGVMVDPNSEEEITAAMKKLYFDEALRKNLSEKGLARAQKFSWEKSVGLMVDEFRTVIELSEK